MIVLTVVDFFCLLVRLYSRHINGKRFKEVTDYVLIFAFPMIVGLVIVTYGSFSSDWPSSSGQRTEFKLFLIAHILWIAATTAIRVSLHLLYIHLFSTVNGFRYVSTCMIIFNLMNFTAQFFGSLIICIPWTYIYYQDGNGHCGDIGSFDLYTAIMSIILDAAVTILPLPILWNLRVEIPKKLGISIIVSLGFCICALTIVRLFLPYEPGLFNEQWTIRIFLTSLEPIIGFCVACLPFFAGVLKHVAETKRHLALMSRLPSCGMPCWTSSAPNKASELNQMDEMELGLRSDSHSMRLELDYSFGDNDGVSARAERMDETVIQNTVLQITDERFHSSNTDILNMKSADSTGRQLSVADSVMAGME
ncbi:hypothetical protein K461DRAFT_316460, partial [Myriangium duriaei CBS 260.36]